MDIKSAQPTIVLVHGAVEDSSLWTHGVIQGAVETFEALIRWNHPERGTIPPMDFIPLAEESGLIDGLGRWVIDTACREAAAWRQPWRVPLNVSPRQFHQTDVCAVLEQAMEANALTPARVVVELTESILIEDTPKVIAILHQLKDLGVSVALDDFGTGYSSLSYLQFFHFDTFKIDKFFVKKLGENGDALTIIRAIVNLGHNLGLQVTAEGVETRAQLETLRSLGCDQIQGYVVARPARIDAFTDLDALQKRSFGPERQRLSA